MKPIILSSLYLLILFCLSTFVFDPAYLYYEIWWLDIPMHVLGGFGLAFFAGSILTFLGKSVTYWKIIIFYLIIATGWEFYEYLKDIVLYTDKNSWKDTLSDFINGLIGMSAAYYLVRK